MSREKKRAVREQSEVETLVVGAGPAGRLVARRLQMSYPAMQILVLEAEDRVGGRSASGFHLVDVTAARRTQMKTGPSFLATKVRWNRSWVDAPSVDWTHKDWVALVPQWEYFLKSPQTFFLDIPEAEVDVAVKCRSAVNGLSRLDDSSGIIWKVDSADHSYLAKRVVWAAGITAFQNAFGKTEAQEFLVANPLYKKEAADFRGGLSLEIVLKEKPVFEEGFTEDSLFALPVKHNGKYLLLFGFLCARAKGYSLMTLVHAHQDLLADAKEIMSLEKSLKRGLKSICQWTDESFESERLVVNSRVGGHVLGTPWLLGPGLPASLEFVGDESAAAIDREYLDTAGALASVDALFAHENRQNSDNAPSVLV